jgi:hypothetical protein
VRRTVTIITVMATLAMTPVLAQEAPEQLSDTPAQEQAMPMAPGMMGSSGDIIQMMEMMNRCASAIENMHSGVHDEMGMGHVGQTMPGMMDGGIMDGRMMGGQGMQGSEDVRFDQAAADGLARAYLAGRSPEPVEIQRITLDAGVYTVAYSQGGEEGTLTVDAASGEVQAETR